MATITELPKTSLTFEQKLDRLAQVAVNVGLGLERGQELVMTATLDALLWPAALRSTLTKQEPPSSQRCLPMSLLLCSVFAMDRCQLRRRACMAL